MGKVVRGKESSCREGGSGVACASSRLPSPHSPLTSLEQGRGGGGGRALHQYQGRTLASPIQIPKTKHCWTDSEKGEEGVPVHSN